MARTPGVVEDRREQILDAAMQVFAQKGFSRATNKDIAREAGITPGLIYHYFDSKETLLRAVIETRSPLALVHSLPQEVFDLPVEDFLRLLLQRMLALVESEQFVQLIRVLLPELLHNPNITPISASAFQQITSIIEGYLQRKMEQQEIQSMDARLITQILIGSVMGTILRRQIMRDPSALHYTHTEIVETIITTTLSGLIPR